ncbi:AAA family ATPase, partial [Erysipelothrix rhusiopathiae]|nr:AAA family ATPase [Erysipelothrix rhusiopathiae]
PIVGMNESGKTTIIEAIYAFDNGNDELNNGSHVNEIKNQYSVINNKDAKISFHIKDNIVPYFIIYIEEQMEMIYLDVENHCNKIIDISKNNESYESQLVDIKEIIEESRAQKKGKLYKGTFEKFNSLLESVNNDPEYKEYRLSFDSNEASILTICLKKLETIKVFRNLTSQFLEIDEYVITRVFPDGKKELSYYTLENSNIPELEDKTYYDSVIDEIVKSVMLSLPQLIYIDEFSKPPKSRIQLNDKNDYWYKIFNNVFKQVSLKNYNQEVDITKMLDLEKNNQDMFLEDVSLTLSNTFKNAWKDLKTDKENIKFKLDLNTESQTFIDPESNEEKKGNVNVLSIRIVEVKEGLSYSISELSSRSKGFIWYYNFIMNTNFIPSYKKNANCTIFLIDEPGAYLHSTAQTELLNNLVYQAVDNYIIYTTHSPALLNPDIVPSNNILIAHKEDKNIIVSNITNYKSNISNKDRTHALEAVYDALRIPMYDQVYTENVKVICVEGIYDLYFLKLFCNLDSDVRIFPGTGAQSIYKNISYFITYSIPYICIWDNDPEGVKCLEAAQKFYGPIESQKMITLSVCENNVSEMETILGEKEIGTILPILRLKTTNVLKQDYQNMLLELSYKCDDITIKEIIDNLEHSTTQKIAKLESKIRYLLKQK